MLSINHFAIIMRSIKCSVSFLATGIGLHVWSLFLRRHYGLGSAKCSCLLIPLKSASTKGFVSQDLLINVKKRFPSYLPR